jgi:surface protein
VSCTDTVFCTDDARPNISEALGNRTNTCGVGGIVGYCSSPAPSLSPSLSLSPPLRPSSRPSLRPSRQPSSQPSNVPSSGRQAFQDRTELDTVLVSYLSLQAQALMNNFTALSELNIIKGRYGHMKNWDVSNINDMSSLFSGATFGLFNEDISRWNVSQVTTMQSMFSNAQMFDQNLSLWDVSKVTNMLRMFKGCDNFRGIGLEHWSTYRVQTMFATFDTAVFFNGNLSRWDTSQVVNMAQMFRGTEVFQGIGLEDWNTSQVINMASMFYLATKFNGNISHWDVSKVTSMNSMFQYAYNFTGVDGNTIDSIGIWNVGQVKYFSYTFANASSFRANLSSWNIASVLEKNNMFDNASSFPGVPWYP